MAPEMRGSDKGAARMARTLFAAFLLTLFCLTAGTAHAQDAGATGLAASDPDWHRTIVAAESYVERGDAVETETALFVELLDEVLAKAAAVKVNAGERRDEQRQLLEALGPAPDTSNGEAESEDIAVLRQQYAKAIQEASARIAAADTAIVRATQLKTEVAGLARQELAEKLNQRTARPWDLDQLQAGLAELGAKLFRIASAPGELRKRMTEPEWRAFVADRAPFMAGIVIVAALLGWLLRRLVLRRFGYRSDTGDISQARRLGAAVVHTLADGLVPTLLIIVLFFWLRDELSGLPTPILTNILEGAAAGLGLVALAYAGLNAALTPDAPAWRLLPVSDRSARAITRRALLFAAVSAVDVFFVLALRDEAASPAFLTVYAVISCFARALALAPLLSGRLWRLYTPTGSAGADPNAGERPRSFIWAAARLALAAAAFGAVAASLFGYAEFALFVSRALSATLAVLGAVFLLRGALRETVQTAFRSPRVRRWIGLSEDGADTASFWAIMFLEPAFLVAGAFLVAPIWGFSRQEMLTWLSEAARGFTIGDVRISFTEIGIAALAFFIVLAITRAARRAMLERLLPRTRIDVGVQHSLATGFGYVGALVAAIIGVSALGVDLSNLAIVAGALSVGIGFGLQSIVNNFVSGLILLIERPVKVGDWVVVGGQEGLVKQISIRATEVETFERTSVIIPNSELISNSVINRTHKDRYGRIDIPVGVAYGSDTRRVSELLLEAANAQSEILDFPEAFVLFTGFGDSSLDFELRCYTANNIRGIRIATEIRHAINERFIAEGVEIPFPQRVIHRADEQSAESVP